MTATDFRDRLQDYGYKRGFLNICYLTGMIRFKTKAGFFLQQTERLGQSPFIYLPANTTIPSRFREGDLVNVRARMFGCRGEEGAPAVRLEMLRMDGATPMDISPTEAWSLRPKETDAIGTPTPESFLIPKSVVRMSDGDRPSLVAKFRPSSNMVKFTGFIHSQVQATNPQTGEPVDNAYYIMVRVTADPEECIPVKVVKKNALLWMKSLKVGYPVYIGGNIRVRVKPTEVSDNPDAERLVTWPYVRTERGPELAAERDLGVDEAWAQETIAAAIAKKRAEGNGELLPKGEPPAEAHLSAPLNGEAQPSPDFSRMM